MQQFVFTLLSGIESAGNSLVGSSGKVNPAFLSSPESPQCDMETSFSQSDHQTQVSLAEPVEVLVLRLRPRGFSAAT